MPRAESGTGKASFRADDGLIGWLFDKESLKKIRQKEKKKNRNYNIVGIAQYNDGFVFRRNRQIIQDEQRLTAVISSDFAA